MKFQKIINSPEYSKWIKTPPQELFKVIDIYGDGTTALFIEQTSEIPTYKLTRIWESYISNNNLVSVDAVSLNPSELLDNLSGWIKTSGGKLEIINPQEKHLSITSEENQTPFFIDLNDFEEVGYLLYDLESNEGATFVATDGLENVLFSSSDLKEVEEYLKPFVDQSNQ